MMLRLLQALQLPCGSCATTVLHVMKITSNSTHLILQLFKIHTTLSSPQHVCLDNHSKFFLPPSPRVVAKIINKLLVTIWSFSWERKEVIHVSSYLNLLPNLLFSAR